MNKEDGSFLLVAAFGEWTRLRSTYRGARWREKLNNFELSQLDAVIGRMDCTLRDIMALERQRLADSHASGDAHAPCALDCCGRSEVGISPNSHPMAELRTSTTGSVPQAAQDAARTPLHKG